MLGKFIVSKNHVVSNKAQKITSKDLWYTPYLIGVCIVLMLALIGADFWLSFAALNELALSTGYDVNQAFVWPLTIDTGLLMVTILVFTATLNKWSKALKVYAWVLLATFSLLTIAGNALSAGVITQTFDVNLAVKLFVHLTPPVFYVALTELLRLTFANIVTDNVQAIKTEIKEAKKAEKQQQKLTPQEERQQYILNALRAGRNIIFTELGEELNTTRQTISRDVNELVNEGVISKNGDGNYHLTGEVTQ